MLAKLSQVQKKRYANIERELLAVIFGCIRFHTYIYGARFTIQSTSHWRIFNTRT